MVFLFAHQTNIERFERELAEAKDEKSRAILQTLLEEERGAYERAKRAARRASGADDEPKA